MADAANRSGTVYSAPRDGDVKWRRRKRKSPLWARWLIAIGAILVLGSGSAFAGMKAIVHTATNAVTQKKLIGGAGPSAKHVDIKGAKNILLVGLDVRPGEPLGGTRSDTIILMHISASHDQAYLVSLPRDSFVEIPRYNNGKHTWPGGQNKINGAFAQGSLRLAGDAALAHGFELLGLTIKNLAGIKLDAGGIIDFPGFQQVVNVLGKVCMYVDDEVTSIHIGYRRNGAKAGPYIVSQDGAHLTPKPGVTPKVYHIGNHCFTPEEALDYARQRDLLGRKDYDYGRQRHQQQLIKAIMRAVVSSGLDSPTKLPGLLKAVGKTMTVDSGNIPLEDWAFALRGINPDNLVTIKTNRGTFNSKKVPGAGDVQILDDNTMKLLASMKNDTVGDFVLRHPDLAFR